MLVSCQPMFLLCLRTSSSFAFGFSPLLQGPWGGRNHGARRRDTCLVVGFPMASWGTKSGLDLPGLFGHLIKHISPRSPALHFTGGTCSA